MSFEGKILKLQGQPIGKMSGENLTIWRKVWRFNINTPFGRFYLAYGQKPIVYRIKIKQKDPENIFPFHVEVRSKNTLLHKGSAMAWCGLFGGKIEEGKTTINALLSFYLAWRALLQPIELPVEN